MGLISQQQCSTHRSLPQQVERCHLEPLLILNKVFHSNPIPNTSAPINIFILQQQVVVVVVRPACTPGALHLLWLHSRNSTLSQMTGQQELKCRWFHKCNRKGIHMLGRHNNVLAHNTVLAHSNERPLLALNHRGHSLATIQREETSSGGHSRVAESCMCMR